jgi:hypothetical protein
VSGLALPPAEPPAASVVDVLEQLRVFREHRDDAGRQLHMIQQAIREHDAEQLPTGTLTYYRIEARVARNRLMLWTREVRALERRARALGLKP